MSFTTAVNLTLSKWRLQEATIVIKEASCQSGRSVVLVAKYCKRYTASRDNISIGLECFISRCENIFLKNLVSHWPSLLCWGYAWTPPCAHGRYAS